MDSVDSKVSLRILKGLGTDPVVQVSGVIVDKRSWHFGNAI